MTNRRTFLTRAGLLFGSVGLADSFKLDLMNRLAGIVLPQAGAAMPLPRRQIELCFRSGIPMMIFGTGKEFSALSAPRYSNFSYAGNQILKSGESDNLYLNADSQSLMKHAGNIAITQGTMNEGGHTDLFNFREGGQGKARVTPIVELANANNTGSILHGVQWPGSARNQAGDKKDLVGLNTTSAFMSLFKNPRLRMTASEVAIVLDGAEKLSRRQALLLEGKLTDSLSHFASHRKAAQMFAADFSKMLSTQDMAPALTTGSDYMGQRQALAQSLKAMQNNLINSSMVVFELGDWHGYQTDKQNANIIRSVSEIISSVVAFLKVTPEPSDPSLTLWDTTLIVAGSEFTRGITQFNRDNSDGNTQGVMLIGKNIRGNYYGGFTLSDSSGASEGMAHGFDPISGTVTMGQNNTPEQLYYTIKQASGLPLTTTEREKVLSCMLS